jgi:NADPH-dependent ferric siderophore reductase
VVWCAPTKAAFYLDFAGSLKEKEAEMMKQSRATLNMSPLATPADEKATQTVLRALRVGAQDVHPALRRHLRFVRLKSSVRLTPNMQRVTLEGEGLSDFPSGQEGAHIRIMLPHDGQGECDFVDQLERGHHRPLTRTYTVRHHRPEANEIDIDFALHAHGMACNWALSAGPGALLAVAGPGSKKLTDFSAEWFLLVADMTAIPAAAAVLDEMPRSAVGHAVFEIASDEDRQPMTAPPGIDIRWLINPSPEVPSNRQFEMVRSVPWLSGMPGVFVAGESSVMKSVRQFLLEEKNIDRKAIYASAYWKIGFREDQLRKLKDREAAAANGTG